MEFFGSMRPQDQDFFDVRGAAGAGEPADHARSLASHQFQGLGQTEIGGRLRQR